MVVRRARGLVRIGNERDVVEVARRAGRTDGAERRGGVVPATARGRYVNAPKGAGSVRTASCATSSRRIGSRRTAAASQVTASTTARAKAASAGATRAARQPSTTASATASASDGVPRIVSVRRVVSSHTVGVVEEVSVLNRVKAQTHLQRPPPVAGPQCPFSSLVNPPPLRTKE